MISIYAAGDPVPGTDWTRSWSSPSTVKSIWIEGQTYFHQRKLLSVREVCIVLGGRRESGGEQERWFKRAQGMGLVNVGKGFVGKYTITGIGVDFIKSRRVYAKSGLCACG